MLSCVVYSTDKNVCEVESGFIYCVIGSNLGKKVCIGEIRDLASAPRLLTLFDLSAGKRAAPRGRGSGLEQGVDPPAV